jgi:rRNA maturation RNase YbeY
LGTEAKLNGAVLFLDPAWQEDPDQDIIEKASHHVHQSPELDARLAVGRNSVATLADTSTSKDSAKATTFTTYAEYTADNSVTWGPCTWDNNGNIIAKNGSYLTAALSILTPYTLAKDGNNNPVGGILVDGSMDRDFLGRINNEFKSGNATFNANSLLMIAGSAATGSNVALTAAVPNHDDSKLTVADNARIYGTTKTNEMHRIIAHGVLHLCGQKDKTERAEKQMHRKEDKYLKLLEEM